MFATATRPALCCDTHTWAAHLGDLHREAGDMAWLDADRGVALCEAADRIQARFELMLAAGALSDCTA